MITKNNILYFRIYISKIYIAHIYFEIIDMCYRRKMAKSKTREITITNSKGTFSLFKKQGSSKSDYDFSGVLALRQLLSNEKARILHTIKTKKPQSIYDLAKKLGRGFKSVNDDLKLLERFGFIELIEEKTKNRIRHRPEIVVDTITVHLKV